MEFERVIAVRTGKTIYRDKDKVIKLFEEDYKKSNVFNEALNHARAEELNLSVPRLFEVNTIEGKTAIISEYIKGKTLDQLMNADPSKLDEYLDLFVNLQIEIHTKSQALLTKTRDRLFMKINQAPIDAITKYDLFAELESMPKHNHVLHGDFNPSNIIIRESDNKPYIIDWAHMTQGNASADVAKSYLLFYLTGNFNLAEKYLDLYQEKTKTLKKYIQKWIPIISASQLSVCKKEEVEFLKHWINIVDHE